MIVYSHGADPSTPLSQLSTINCNMKNEKTTAFQYAASKGLDLVNTLLKYIKCANHKDSLNRNAIFYAILTDRGDNADIVKRLIDSGVKVNEKESVDGNTPLIIASSKSLKDSVKALLEGGADPNIQNNAGNTALHMATNIDIVNLLLSYHANIEIKNRDGENSIELASFRNKTNIYEVLVREKNSRETKEKNLASELEQERQERSLNLSVNNNLNKKSLKATNNTSRSIEHIQTTPNQTYYQPGGQQNNYSPNQVNKIMHSNSGTINDKSSQNTFSIDSQSLIIKPNQSINSQMNFNGNSLNHNSNPYLYKNMSEIGLNNTVSENHMPYRSYNNNSSAINDGGVSYNNQSQNISININNMQTFNNHNSNRKVRNGGRIRFTKSKLAKKTFYNESNGAFNKVFNDSGYPQSNIEIPFNFIKNSSKIDVNNNNNQSQLHTYISKFLINSNLEMQNLPILNIDISNDHKEMQLINSQYADDSSKRGEINEKRFRQIIEENIAIKDINEKLQKQLIEKEDELNRLRQAYSKIDTDQKETIIVVFIFIIKGATAQTR